MFSLSWADLVLKSKMSDGGDSDGQHSDRIADIGSGSWTYESFHNQKTPVYKVALWDNKSTILSGGLVLAGRDESTLAGNLCLLTSGFYYSKDMDHFSRKRQMTIADILAATDDNRPFFQNGKICSGLSHSAMKRVYEDHPLSVEVSALAEQSEFFGRGLYNDSILTSSAPDQRILTNFDSLLQFGVT